MALDIFYAEIFRMQRDAPDRYWVLCNAILSRALTDLETHPKETGVELVIARCMPLREDGKVRSLRRDVGLGTAPWRRDLHAEDYFLGAESLAGYVALHQHGEMIPDTQKPRPSVPVHAMEFERSTAAYPITKEGKIAGVLIVSSTEPNYFSPERLARIELYARSLQLAFYDEEFISSSDIELGMMPRWSEQRAYLDSFWNRVEVEYRRTLREGSFSGTHLVQSRVLGLLEAELLNHIPPS